MPPPRVHTPPRAAPPPRLHDTDLLVPALECAVLNRVARGDAAAGAGRAPRTATPFHALEPPAIAPADYLARLARYAFCSRSVFVAAVLYLDMAADAAPELAVTSLTVHRLLVTAVVVATKSFDDVLYDNAHFAKVGGLDLCELNALELEFLRVLRFGVHVSRARFAQAEAALVAEALSGRAARFRALRYGLALAGLAAGKGGAEPGSPASVMDLPASAGGPAGAARDACAPWAP
jgi:hypothetical protein